jgi:hypothetical protein
MSIRSFLDEYGFFIFFGTIMFLLFIGFCLKKHEQYRRNRNQRRYNIILQEESRYDKPPDYVP